MPRSKNNSQNNQNNQDQVGATNQQVNSENNSEVKANEQVNQEEESKSVIKNPETEQSEKPGIKPTQEEGSTEPMVLNAEEYTLSVVQQLEQRGINVARLDIKVNGEPVFAMKDGGIDRAKNQINDRHAELLRKALTDPASMKGSVKISQGGRVLVFIENGRVITDAVGLTKNQSAKVEIDSPEALNEKSKSPDSVNEGLYQRYAQDVKQIGLAGSREIATNALKDGLDRGQVVEMMKAHDPEYKKLAKESNDITAERTVVARAEVKALEAQSSQTEQQSQEVAASQSKGRSR